MQNCRMHQLKGIFLLTFLLITISFCDSLLDSEPGKLGDSCNLNPDCKVADSWCDKLNRVCACRNGYAASEDNRKCIGNTPISHPCSKSSQCLGYESDLVICSDVGTCECENEYIYSDRLQKCLRKINTIGSEGCQEDIQCQAGLPGALSKCLANPSFSSLTSSAIVAEKVCGCAAEGVNQNHHCYRRASIIGDPCDVHIQCTITMGSGSRCDLSSGVKVCRCIPGFNPATDKMSCMQQANLNDPCWDAGQCNHIKYANCSFASANPGIGFVCKCNEAYIQSAKEASTCKPIVKEVGMSCTEDIQCSTGIDEFAECLDNKVCQCKSNYGYHDGHCYISAKLNEPCEVDGQCQVGVNNYTVCSEPSSSGIIKKCVCQTGAIPLIDKCILRKEIGSSCGSNKECEVSIPGQAHCDETTLTCQCKSGSKPDGDNKMCSGCDSMNAHYHTLIVASLMLLSTIIFHKITP